MPVPTPLPVLVPVLEAVPVPLPELEAVPVPLPVLVSVLEVVPVPPPEVAPVPVPLPVALGSGGIRVIVGWVGPKIPCTLSGILMVGGESIDKSREPQPFEKRSSRCIAR